MLRQLRNKKTAKKVWIILAVVVIPPFILWGSGSLMRNKQEAISAGKIFGKKVSPNDFTEALAAVKNQMLLQFGDKFEEVKKYLNLEEQAWNRLILLAEAKRRKIKVSDKEVVELLESYPFFQKKGRFDNSVYMQTLRYFFRTQPRTFEEQTRGNLILAKLYKEVTESIGVTEQEIKEEYRKVNERLSIYYIAAISADFAKDIAVSEQEIKAYFTKNSLAFKQPLSFNIEYISLSLEGTDKGEAEIKIKAMLERLNKKEPLSQVAQDAGLQVKESGLFKQTDAIPGIGWSPEILNQLSKAKPGELINPLLIDKNYYIIKLKEQKEPYIPDLETIKEDVKNALIKERSLGIAKEKAETALLKLKGAYQTDPKSADFEKVAKENGIKSDSTDLFKYGGYIEGIGASDKFWTTAQDLKENEFSEIIEASSGFYIIRLKTREQIDEKKFEAEKKEFSQKLEATKKADYFEKFNEEIKRRAQS